MTETIGWGILGAGNIAATFVRDLKLLPEARLVAVGARDLGRARAFATEHGFARAYGSYAELVADSTVDVIYVATPHNFHREHSLLCLEAGKAVLCEKPAETDAGRVADIIAAARAKNLFWMEAMWTRFLPIMAQVRRWLNEGRIGAVRQVVVDFGMRFPWDPRNRLFDPNLAGGALLDLGVYGVALTHMVMKQPPSSLSAAARLTETGVDEQTGLLLGYPDGALAQVTCAARSETPQQALIVGTEGWITIPEFWHASAATLTVSGQASIEVTGQAGYRFEAAEVMVCLRAGKTQSAIMPWEESLAIARTLEQARRQIGVRYPWEG